MYIDANNYIIPRKIAFCTAQNKLNEINKSVE